MKKSEEILKRTIVLAEDDESMRRFLQVTLERQGFAVLSARDGLEALEIALKNDIDAVVTDAVMPNLTGFDLCRILRQNPDKKHVPIILLTGFDQPDLAEKADSQIDALLTKEKQLNERLPKTLSELITETNRP